MATINPRLKKDKPKANGECPIGVVYQNGREECWLSVDRTIHPDHWNQGAKSMQWVKSSFQGHTELNQVIYRVTADATQIMNQFELLKRRLPGKLEMRDLYKRQSGGSSPDSNTLISLFKEFMRYQHLERGIDNVTYGTYLIYKVDLARLEKYQVATKKTLGFDDLKIETYNSLLKYFSGNDYATNSIGTFMTTFRTYLHWCNNVKGISIADHVIKIFKSPSESKWFVHLEFPEILQLMNTVLPAGSKMERMRDAFCLQCFLGCRYGDIARMVKENIASVDGRYLVRLKSRKTGKLHIIPLMPLAARILEKYKGVDPSQWVLWDTDYNRPLKDACEMAGLTEMVQTSTGDGDKREDVLKPKFELITSHTARRTFINLMKKAGVDDYIISTMTGQSIQTIQRYKHANTNDIEQAMEKFNQLMSGAQAALSVNYDALTSPPLSALKTTQIAQQ